MILFKTPEDKPVAIDPSCIECMDAFNASCVRIHLIQREEPVMVKGTVEGVAKTIVEDVCGGDYPLTMHEEDGEEQWSLTRCGHATQEDAVVGVERHGWLTCAKCGEEIKRGEAAIHTEHKMGALGRSYHVICAPRA